LTVIQDVLDHGSIEMTARYARMREETVKRAVKRWHERVNIRAALRDRGGARGMTAGPARVPVRQRASDASLRSRLRAALDEGQRQREELARLREELALAHGRVRELELDRRLRRT
jgi:hypothetical protein